MCIKIAWTDYILPLNLLLNSLTLVNQMDKATLHWVCMYVDFSYLYKVQATMCCFRANFIDI